MEREPPSTGHLRWRSDASQRIEQHRSGASGLVSHAPKRERRPALAVIDGEDLVERIFVGVDVHHPAEDDGLEAATGVFASVFCCNRTLETECGPVGRPKWP